MTSNEITEYRPQALAAQDISYGTIVPAGGSSALSLTDQLRQWDEAYRIGQGLCRSKIIPEVFQLKPSDQNSGRDAAADIAVVVMRANTLGVDAMTALETMFVVKGKVSMSAKMKAALIRSKGHILTEVEASDTAVRYYAKRRDTGAEFTSEWTIERATRAKYTTNDKYQTNPQQMLRWKCIGEIGDALFSDVLLGISSTEDLIIDADAEEVAPKAAARGVTGLKAKLGITSKPDATEAATMATKDQQQHVAIALGHVGAVTKSDKLDRLEAQFGRTFNSSSELTADEATTLLAVLEQEKNDKLKGGGK